MSYVLVNKQTRVRCSVLPRHGGTYKTEAAARAAITRYRDGRMSLGDDYEVMEITAYRKEVPMREVTNIMTGKKVMERADTPFHCSVSSESYWCS